MSEPFYITTAIAYPNGRPHIGHAYEAIAADVIARFMRGQGRDVRLVTGTDEHGLKMVQTARGQERETLEFADEMSGHFRAMCDGLSISYDAFVRTTEERHHAASIALWKAMEANGDLYLDRYEGWYSVRDEAYYDEKELIPGEGDEKLSPQGTPVEWTVEESWFFKLSNYADRLLAQYEANPDFIRPDSRRNEIIRFVEGGLKDLSVSRTSFDWGVPVPGSPGHVMYVWVDALTTYMTGVGFPDDRAEYDRFWPADLHLIGKDIVRFHAVYWPAFLMSANLPLPKSLFGHGFLLARGEKMSKSLGNVVDPMMLAETYGVDSLRYFLMREVSFGQDGSYSDEAIVTRCNAELANSFGNLAQRTFSMIVKNLEGTVPPAGTSGDDAALLAKVTEAEQGAKARFADYDFSAGLEAWMAAVFAANAYVDAQAPWALRKTDQARMAEVLGTLAAVVERLGAIVAPVVPGSIAKLDAYLEEGRAAGRLSPPSPIFPRLELVAAEEEQGA
jgi:methionyl-tRNA synthetase